MLKEKLRVGPVLATSILGSIGMLGCGGGTSRDEALSKSIGKYNEVYEQASPVERYVLSFGMTTRIPVIKNSVTLTYWHSYFGNGCLDGTAYDVDGGQISAKIYGLFSRIVIEGKAPTALATAESNSTDPDELIIKAGKENVSNLVFRGLVRLNGSTLEQKKERLEEAKGPASANQQFVIRQSVVWKPEDVHFLTPGNSHTENTLKTYGCKLGYQGTESEAR